MVKKNRAPPKKGLWAYTYDITLPDQADQLQALQGLLDQERTEAGADARTWAGRVVIDPQVTRILVVTDTPGQDRDVNRRIEAELKLLQATFEITVPLAVEEAAASPP